MSKRIKIILILLVLSVTLSFMSNTYSRYVVESTSDIQLSFAKWQILVNEQDITDGTISNIEITPVVENSTNVKSNTIAPSSKGYFDILINPSNVEVSFDYTITIDILNENLPDILISKYSIIDSSNSNKTTYEKYDITEDKITGTLTFDNETENFKYEPFTVRVYFEWFEGENENMNDETDTSIGIDAAKNNTQLQIAASIEFEQKL